MECGIVRPKVNGIWDTTTPLMGPQLNNHASSSLGQLHCCSGSLMLHEELIES